MAISDQYRLYRVLSRTSTGEPWRLIEEGLDYWKALAARHRELSKASVIQVRMEVQEA